MFSQCFTSAQDLIVKTYLEYSDNKCNENLERAKASFVKLDIEDAMDKLSNIFPGNKCYDEAQILYNEIKLKVTKLEEEAKAIKENDKKQELEKQNKRWELLLKEYDLEIAEYKDDKLFRQKIEEKALELAIERSKTDASFYKEKQNSTILIIK